MRAQAETKGHPNHGMWKRMTFAFYSLLSCSSLMLQVAIPGIADLQLQMNC